MRFNRNVIIVIVLLGLSGCSNQAGSLENPKPIRSVKVGSKIDGSGQDFQFIIRNANVDYAYLDFIQGKFTEGTLSSDWSPVVTRTLSLEREQPAGLHSFLIYEGRNEYNDILFRLKEVAHFWSHREQRWKKVEGLTGGSDSRWFAGPVRSQLPWKGEAFIWSGRMGDPPSYLKMDFLREDLSLISTDSEGHWVCIGRWDGQNVLAKVRGYKPRPDSNAAASRWSVSHFDLEDGRVGEEFLPPIRSKVRTRDARFVAVNTLLIEVITGAWIYRWTNNRWEARNIENVELVNMLRDETSAFSTHGGGVFRKRT